MKSLLGMTLIATTLLSTAAGADQGDKNYYFAGTNLHLGAGYDPVTMENALDCFKPSKIISKTSPSNPDKELSTKFRITEVRSRRELEQSLGFSVDAKAHYGIVSGEASFSMEDQYKSDKESIYWVMSAETDYGNYGPEKTELKDKYQAYLDSGKYEQFATQCGKSVVTQERRGAKAYVVFKLENANEETKKNMSAMLHLAASGPVGGGELNSSFSSTYREALKNSNVTLSVDAVGGPGKGVLAKMVTDGTDLDSLKKALQDYVKAVDANNAAPIEYFTTSMTKYLWHPSARDRQLDRWSLTFDRIVKNYFDATSIVDTRFDNEHDEVSAEQLLFYMNEADRFRELGEELALKIDHCKEDVKACGDLPNEFKDRNLNLRLPSHGDSITSCARYNAQQRCMQWSFKPNQGKPFELVIGDGKGFSATTPPMASGTQAMIMAEGTLTQNARIGNGDPGIYGWTQKLILKANDKQVSSGRINTHGGHGYVATTAMMRLSLGSIDVPTDGRVKLTLENVEGSIDGGGSSGGLSVEGGKDFEISVRVLEDSTERLKFNRYLADLTAKKVNMPLDMSASGLFGSVDSDQRGSKSNIKNSANPGLKNPGGKTNAS